MRSYKVTYYKNYIAFYKEKKKKRNPLKTENFFYVNTADNMDTTAHAVQKAVRTVTLNFL